MDVAVIKSFLDLLMVLLIIGAGVLFIYVNVKYLPPDKENN